MWEAFYKQFITLKGYENVLMGLRNTLIIAFSGLAIGIVIGTIVAAVQVVPKRGRFMKFLSMLAQLYTGIFRGTPIIVQLLVFHFIIFIEIFIHICSKVI